MHISQQKHALASIILSHALAVSAAPANPVSLITPGIFAVQPNQGGDKADDCGGGPIKLNSDVWASHNMDSLISGIFSAGASDPNFDFHQVFANKYGVDFYCPNSFQNCQSEPSSCSSLTGSTADKEQGWLGIKAMMNVQEMYLQYEKVISNSVDGLSTLITDFQTKFAPPKEGASLSAKVWSHVISNGLAVVGAGVAFINPIAGAAVASVGAGLGALMDSSNDAKDAAVPPELDVLKISDLLPIIKQSGLSGVESSHNATFSNGKSGSLSTATMKDLLANGVFSGGEVLQAYANQGLDDFYSRFMAIKLLQAFWASQGGFFIYIPGVTKDCSGWHKNTGSKDVLRYCGANGMLIMAAVGDDGQFSSPGGASNENVASIGNYGIQLQQLYASTYDLYTGHGLTAQNEDPVYYFTALANKYVGNKDANGAYSSAGFFSLPVCELKAWDWKQSDNMGTKSPPCDCLCATDAWGHKFMDSAPTSVQNWIKSGKCPACS